MRRQHCNQSAWKFPSNQTEFRRGENQLLVLLQAESSCAAKKKDQLLLESSLKY